VSLDSRLIQIMPAVGMRYGASPHIRHYHNWDHIVALFDLIDKHNLELNIPQYLAVLFHDIVYEPGSPTNERDSSEMMRNMVTSLFTAKQLNDAAIIIHDTKTHIPSSEDSKLVLDLDMAILGQREKHEMFNRTIRHEFGKYSDAEYNAGRSAFFQEVLARPVIYYTKEFHGAYEWYAREYMKNWIASVKN
jgi:predicted metal-dependent HD superfamily phosphohydrolase